MAAPNLVSPSSILSKTGVLLATTTPTAIVGNAAASGKVLRVASLILSNNDASVLYKATVDVYRGGVAYRVGAGVSINAGTTIVLVGRDAPVYLEEGDQLRVYASANSKIEAVCSYEEIM